jgi:hypothetical protein
MATGALFIGWGAAMTGREQKALQVFGEAVQYWTRLQEQGKIEGFETFALDPHGGDLQGFAILRGDRAQLAPLFADPDFVNLNTRANLVVENFGVTLGHTGEGLNQLFADFGKHAAELTT